MEQNLQPQQQVVQEPEKSVSQNESQPEGIGMARATPENSSLELLGSRRIDQIVAKKESERANIAQAMKNSELRGREEGSAEGYNVGAKHGFITGASVGLEDGYNKALEHNGIGLGSSLPISKSN